jgi:hypothetical protein
VSRIRTGIVIAKTSDVNEATVAGASAEAACRQSQRPAPIKFWLRLKEIKDDIYLGMAIIIQMVQEGLFSRRDLRRGIACEGRWIEPRLMFPANRGRLLYAWLPRVLRYEINYTLIKR